MLSASTSARCPASVSSPSMTCSKSRRDVDQRQSTVPEPGGAVQADQGLGIRDGAVAALDPVVPEFFTDQYGLIVDYLAEYMREWRSDSAKPF